MTARDRALGAFYGLALGDALGMPTQSLSRAQIHARFGAITTLEDAGPDQPIAANMPAGSITDDTEQAMLVATLLIEGHGRIAPQVLARRLTEWEDVMRAKGSLDLLGPSTKRAIDLIVAGHSPQEAGRFGTTNGAAMRITPIGIAFDVEDGERFLDAVVQACQVTHNTTLGIASAAAVAAAVSAGINGVALEAALDAAEAAAAAGERHGYWVAGARIAPRLRWARELARATSTRDLPERLYDVVGTSVASQESVVAAFALAQHVASRRLDAFAALGLAAGIGGDTDTIAAILGAMLGAVGGLAVWPADLLDRLRSVNKIDLAPLVEGLLQLRGH